MAGFHLLSPYFLVSLKELYSKQRECSSDIGRRKNRQEVDLAQFCLDRGTILHELNHVVGFEHEHVRPDRDQYIEVIWDNFTSEEFKKEMYIVKDRKRWSVFNESYDLYSLMHYGPYAYGNGKITIRARDSYFQNIIGQGKGFSAKDIRKIRKMYNCLPDRPQDVIY
ncbi:Zinc metalloproteinase nas-4 [Armadillidium nasatum]|uniref:Metalloendopeptidase n=1 Tax=Armadillidium nasatum TaxID=96803 RepID=A0A5N5TFY3_9CRUS|nr:Zinc metalloproteinase nas-4 [Armadillidium nasatum]